MRSCAISAFLTWRWGYARLLERLFDGPHAEHDRNPVMDGAPVRRMAKRALAPYRMTHHVVPDDQGVRGGDG